MSNIPEKVVAKMFEEDWFSQWLGIECLELGAGKCVLKMQIRKEMLNGFAIAHGGISFSLADSALAFASNAHGKKAFSIETSISHISPVKQGDVLIAKAIEKSLTPRIGIYEITITNQENKTVALFKGTVYRKKEDWFPDTQ